MTRHPVQITRNKGKGTREIRFDGIDEESGLDISVGSEREEIRSAYRSENTDSMERMESTLSPRSEDSQRANGVLAFNPVGNP